MGSRRAFESVGSHPNSGLWCEIQPTSSRFFFANSQQSKCTGSKTVLSWGEDALADLEVDAMAPLQVVAEL